MMMRPVLCAALAMSVHAAPVWAQELRSVDDIMTMADTFCRSFEDGTFDAGDAVHQVELDGAPPFDTIVDSSAFLCTSMATAYCGTGGCSLWTIVGDTVTEFQAEAWRMIEWEGRPILMIARDGGWCGGFGAEQCFEALTWSDGRILTVMPSPE